MDNLTVYYTSNCRVSINWFDICYDRYYTILEVSSDCSKFIMHRHDHTLQVI